MACVEQFQFCNLALPAGDQFGPLAGFDDATSSVANLFSIKPEQINFSGTADNPTASRYL